MTESSQPIDGYTMASIKPDHNISFFNKEHELVAKFDFNGDTLKFTGDPDEGAQLFIDFAMNYFQSRLKEEYDRGRNDTLDEVGRKVIGPGGSAHQIFQRFMEMK